MRIEEIAFSGYKAFPGGGVERLQRLRLAPLTLVFGKNNSGKSVVVRLPRLLLGGLACGDQSLLPLEVRGLKYGGQFVDIVHGGDFFGRPSFGLRARLGGEMLDISATLFSPGALAADEPGRLWEYVMLSPERFEISDPPEESKFRGLLPADARWNPWRDAASIILDEMVHLGPTRASIRSLYEREQPSKIGLAGLEAPQWLRADSALADAVGSWFADHMDGWRLSLSRSNESFSLQVKKNKAMGANLSRSGEGLQQLLPVVTHQIQRQHSSVTDFLDVIEQPEIHLHAAAQAPLADLFIKTAVSGRGTVVVETHSEPLLLRVQRRVAEGVLPHDRVALYFVDATEEGSTLRRVGMNPDGEVDWWPEGVFEEDFHEVAALRRAQRRNS